MAEWDADIRIDRELAAALIAERFPDHDIGALTDVGEGWDNSVWQTGAGVAFRFPRRAMVIPGLHRVMAALPALEAALPAPVPRIAYPGAATERFPWPWFGSPFIPGREIAEAVPEASARVYLAADLGRFLRVLHRQAIPANLATPADRLGRADMATRVPKTQAALADIAEHWHDPRTTTILAAAETLGPAEATVLTHGDLHVRHVLVDADGRLSGVIDWDDIGAAPASIDLSLYWSAFTGEGRRALRTAYGPVGDDTLLRARVLALCFGATLTAYALDIGADALATETLAGLSRTVEDDDG